MRVGIFSNSLGLGGAERQAALWAGCAAELGHELSMLAVHRVESEYELPAGAEVAYAGKRGLRDSARIAACARRLARQCDVVVAFQAYPALFCALAAGRTPWIAVAGGDPRLRSHGSRAIPLWLVRAAYGRAALASAPTDGLRDAWRRAGVEARGGWETVPNIVAESAFVPGASERAGALFVGRLVPEKGPLLAADAAAQAGVPLTVLGDGPLRAAVEERARAGADVRLEPFTPAPWSLYARHRALLLSSEYEAFGNVIVESLAAGTPVVAADCDFGPREVLAGASYSRVVPREQGALAEALAEVMGRPYTADEESECRAIADNYRARAVTPLIEGMLAAATASRA